MVRPKTSKYDLTTCAHLKVPESLYNAYVAKYGKRKWAEGAREVLELGVDSF